MKEQRYFLFVFVTRYEKRTELEDANRPRQSWYVCNETLRWRIALTVVRNALINTGNCLFLLYRPSRRFRIPAGNVEDPWRAIRLFLRFPVRRKLLQVSHGRDSSAGYMAKTGIVSHNQHVMARCAACARCTCCCHVAGDKAAPETGWLVASSRKNFSLILSPALRSRSWP